MSTTDWEKYEDLVSDGWPEDEAYRLSTPHGYPVAPCTDCGFTSCPGFCGGLSERGRAGQVSPGGHPRPPHGPRYEPRPETSVAARPSRSLNPSTESEAA